MSTESKINLPNALKDLLIHSNFNQINIKIAKMLSIQYFIIF